MISSITVKLQTFITSLRSPLVLNGYALVFSSAASSVLGVVYWILVARFYSAEVVGFSSAALASMFFLTNLAQFNLVHALNRFIPSAGQNTGRLVLQSYAASILMAVFTSVIFLFGLNTWAPSLNILFSSPKEVIFFVSATVCWCLFTLQDGVLVGLGQAKWVPLSTITYALAKLVTVVAVATVLPTSGVFVSWTAPVMLILIPTSTFIFLYLIPKHVRSTRGRGGSTPVTPKAFVRFVAGDYLSSLVWVATVNLLPILVLERAGASSSAYFYLAWNIANALYFVCINMCMSLVTESSRDEVKLNYYSYQTLLQALALLIPIVFGIVFTAPFILNLYGSNYATEGATLLRLLVLSAIPYLVMTIYISMARVQRKISRIFVVYSLLCAMVVVLSHFFLGIYGVTGVGVAWLLSTSTITLGLWLSSLRRAWQPYVTLPPRLQTWVRVRRS